MTPEDDQTPLTPQWCLVGNIVPTRPYGESKEPRPGTKHFPPNTKVYILPIIWGDGGDNLRVIGLTRQRPRRWITVVIPSKHITNFRAQLIHKPAVLHRLAQHEAWTSRKHVEESAIWFNQDRPTIPQPAQLAPPQGPLLYRWLVSFIRLLRN